MPLARLSVHAGLREYVLGALLAGVVVVAALFAFETDQNALADPEALARKFEHVVFGNDRGAESSSVLKWSSPVRVRLAGNPDESDRERVQLYLIWLRSLTGLPITIATPYERPNLYVFFVPKNDFWNVVERAGWRSESIRAFVRLVNCFGLVNGISNNKPYATLGIRTDWERPLIESCLLEELVQVLGMPADTEMLRPSIFSRKDAVRELSLNDKILIRTLYDGSITPGMRREDAMRVAREVIAGLVARVGEEGESVLIHPRFLARGGR